MTDPANRWSGVNMFAEFERLRTQHDTWKAQALELLATQTSLLRLMNSLSLEGSRAVAEIPALRVADRRRLLDLFALLHVSMADHEAAAAGIQTP